LLNDFGTLILQVVCDSNLLFLDVTTGNPGSVHDARVFRNSDLKTLLESDDRRLPSEYHLLGDSAYPLKDYLLVPFRDNGHLSRIEITYNRAHSQTRVDVERAIGLLKGKFRRLKDLDMVNVMDTPFLIFASCVLHNFIILQSGVDTDDIDFVESDVDMNIEDINNAEPAVDKRLRIAQLLA